MQPVVYLPVEIEHRELPSRLLIAAHLLQAGYTVVIGGHWSLVTEQNQAAFPPGLYLFKSVNKIQGNAMASVLRHGHIAAANDEEALNFIEYNGYTLAFSENAAESCSLFFAQSDAHKRALEQRFPVLAGRVCVSGNPRIDLLASENRAAFESMDDRVPSAQPYILFNTNYGTINSVWNDGQGVVAVAEAAGAFDGDRESKIAEFNAIVEWEKSNFQAMTMLIDWVARNMSGLNIVLRPHPAERSRHWEKALAGFPNARIIGRSDPHPWIIGAKLVVHTGCTTGLEAALLDRPAVNLLPRDHPMCDRIVTYANPTFRRWKDAATAIEDYLVRDEGPICGHAGIAAKALSAHLPSYRDNAAARLMTEGMAGQLNARGASPGNGFSFMLRAPLIEKSAHELRKLKYNATVDGVGGGLQKAAQIAGVHVQIQLTTLADGVFLAAPV